VSSHTDDVTNQVYEQYLAALRSGERNRAFLVIERAREAGMDLGTLYVGVFQPALRQIGALWQANEITVADEHLATAITQAAMARAFERDFEWSESPGRSLIAACPGMERHEVGLRMICDLLDLAGWETTYLGSSVPVDSLITMIHKKKPDVVALSVAIAPHLPLLRLMIEQIRSLFEEPPLILVGGRPFLDDPSLATGFGADLTAENAVDAVRLLQQRFGST
jgi:MerR family transcriptional regulator, light-induced transcriptional regulator